MILCHSISYLPYIRCHTGTYFCPGWDLQILMELHAYPHLLDVHRDDDLFAIFTMIPRWSLLGAIQLGPHFSALKCHHASPSERYLLDLWVWFSYGCGWLGLHVWWWMTWGHQFFFRPITHLMPYWGIFPFSVEICRSPLICMIILGYEICARLMIWFHFVLILHWSLSWVISSSSYFLI